MEANRVSAISAPINSSNDAMLKTGTPGSISRNWRRTDAITVSGATAVRTATSNRSTGACDSAKYRSGSLASPSVLSTKLRCLT